MKPGEMLKLDPRKIPTDREMLMFVYGALKVLQTNRPELVVILEQIEFFLFPQVIFIDPLNSSK